ncbi:hypothetical protein [Nocardiopsis tropica]|uniref:Uncharacterized protein n=1 Tax=Nocardiopsis tropica TaxID=109330 RepID=A0ABU7KMI5_9ACTN|nr:hypothetical protein [Nocardiopsis umidischolae]MEE2050503.1 hypothetical protein [Nocardiopsis umidischolae]
MACWDDFWKSDPRPEAAPGFRLWQYTDRVAQPPLVLASVLAAGLTDPGSASCDEHRHGAASLLLRPSQACETLALEGLTTDR